MLDETAVIAAEREFFTALMAVRLDSLERILSEDFTLVALDGSLVSKPPFLEVVGSGQLRFEAIEPIEASVRFYLGTAVVVGRTQMRGRLGETAFAAASRYTHVYAERQGSALLVAAQGTPIQAA